MPKISIIHSLLAASVLVSALDAHASDEVDMFQIKGFGTVAATRTDSADNGYKATTQPISLARGGTWSLQNDSLMGVQLDIVPNHDLSGTLQVIARNRAKGDLAADVEWAFVKYKIDNHWRVRVGRVLTPVFMDSDYRFVGYASIYARPDPNIYTIYPLSTHDGLDITYKNDLAGGILTTSLYGGRAKIEGPSDLVYEASRLTGLSLRYEKDNLMVRVAKTQTNMKMTGAGSAMFSTFLTYAQQAVALGCTSCINAVNAIGNGFDDIGFGVSNIGFRYTMDDYTLWGEYLKVNQREILNPVDESYLLGLSKNIAQWTPYITFSENKTTPNASKIDPSDINKIPVPPVKVFMSLYNSPAISARDTGRHTLAIGTRYDIAKNMAVFFEMAKVSVNGNVYGFPLPYPRLVPTGQPCDDTFHLYTLSLSFVF
jgi:hypothetical protein